MDLLNNTDIFTCITPVNARQRTRIDSDFENANVALQFGIERIARRIVRMLLPTALANPRNSRQRRAGAHLVQPMPA